VPTLKQKYVNNCKNVKLHEILICHATGTSHSHTHWIIDSLLYNKAHFTCLQHIGRIGTQKMPFFNNFIILKVTLFTFLMHLLLPYMQSKDGSYFPTVFCLAIKYLINCQLSMLHVRILKNRRGWNNRAATSTPIFY
jgi:hypothetical protein